MKNLKCLPIGDLKIVILLGIIFTLAACSGNQENSSKNNLQSSDVQTSSKPPGMDIHTAALIGDLKVVQQHINAGSDLNSKDKIGGATPLITAAVFGKTQVAKALIKAGADLNLKNNDGSTALHVAAFFCRTEIVEALLDKGIDKNLTNNYGATALESVAGPFSEVKGIYDQLSKDLGPLGFKLNYGYIEKTRPIIAEMLQ